MDDIVVQAMAKWPHVPACTGWLGLDGRGQWWMRDAAAQALGPFQAGGAARGSLLRHAGLVAFIGRNYQSDARGCWYFQNGPQRVDVELDRAPLVWRWYADGWRDHIDRPAQVHRAVLDEHGHLYLWGEGDWGAALGTVHSQDMLAAADWLQDQALVPQECPAAQIPARHGFVLSPARVQATHAPVAPSA